MTSLFTVHSYLPAIVTIFFSKCGLDAEFFNVKNFCQETILQKKKKHFK